MDWNKPWNDEEPDDRPDKTGEKTYDVDRNKWNYIFLESLKLALLLPLIILAVEIFILESWPDIQEKPQQLLFDYLFLFSAVFLIFVAYHLIQWRRHMS